MKKALLITLLFAFPFVAHPGERSAGGGTGRLESAAHAGVTVRYDPGSD